MSLKTRFGNLQDILNPNPYEDHVFVIDSPFITNGLFKKIYNRSQDTTEYISCIVKKENFKLKAEIKRVQEEAERAVETLIKWAGDDPSREGLRETPKTEVKPKKEYFNG